MRLTSGRLLERDGEVAQLDAAVGRLLAGEGGVALIEGPAGIGKSRLLASARRAAVAHGARVLHARAGELERELGFGVVRQLFEGAVAGRGAAPITGAAAAALPVLGDPEQAGEATFSALHALYWLTLDLAEEAGALVLAVDDLHWCDRPSLRFLTYLARRIEDEPVLVVGTARSTDEPTDPVLLADLAADGLVVTPGPLGPDASAELVATTLGAEPEPPFARACHDATGGNPLLLRQLLAALSAEGVAPVAGQATAVRTVGAQTVARTVLRRLKRLDADELAVARAVAVLGDEVALALVAALVELPLDRVAAATGVLARAEILRPDTPLAFVHALVRDAVYWDMAPGERELRHVRAASILRGAGAKPERVVTHLIQVPSGGDDGVAALLHEAGRAAAQRGAPDSAVTLLRRALDEPPADERRRAVLLDLARVETMVDGPAAAEHLAQALEMSRDPAERAWVGELLVKVLAFTGRMTESIAVGRALVAELPGGLDAASRRLEAMMALAAHFSNDAPLLDELLAHHRTPPTDADEGGRLLSIVAATEMLLAAEPAHDVLTLLHAALAGDVVLRADDGVFSPGGIRVLAMCDDPSALGFADSVLSDARRRGSGFAVFAALMWRGVVHLRRGELADATESLLASLHDGRTWSTGVGSADAFARTMLAQVLLEQGDAAAARAQLDAVELPPFPTEPGRWRDGVELRALLAEGRHAGVPALADRVAATYPRVRNPAATPWRTAKALALDRLGRPAEAIAVADEEVALARRFGAASTLGPVLRTRGLIAGGSVELLEESAAVLDGTLARLESARSWAAVGDALLASGREREAQEPLRRALDLAGACGAAGLVGAVRGSLRAAGVRPRATALGGVGALTASERRVAALAADGATNREIAQTLFVTPKTVELHLGSTYRKLGIRSRRELPATLVV